MTNIANLVESVETTQENEPIEVYSAKEDRYITIKPGDAEGEIQSCSYGLGPGSWY